MVSYWENKIFQFGGYVIHGKRLYNFIALYLKLSALDKRFPNSPTVSSPLLPLVVKWCWSTTTIRFTGKLSFYSCYLFNSSSSTTHTQAFLFSQRFSFAPSWFTRAVFPFVSTVCLRSLCQTLTLFVSTTLSSCKKPTPVSRGAGGENFNHTLKCSEMHST